MCDLKYMVKKTHTLFIPLLGHYLGGNLTHHPMLITAFLHIQPEGHPKPNSEIGSLSLCQAPRGV